MSKVASDWRVAQVIQGRVRTGGTRESADRWYRGECRQVVQGRVRTGGTRESADRWYKGECGQETLESVLQCWNKKKQGAANEASCKPATSKIWNLLESCLASQYG